MALPRKIHWVTFYYLGPVLFCARTIALFRVVRILRFAVQQAFHMRLLETFWSAEINLPEIKVAQFRYVTLI